MIFKAMRASPEPLGGGTPEGAVRFPATSAVHDWFADIDSASDADRQVPAPVPAMERAARGDEAVEIPPAKLPGEEWHDVGTLNGEREGRVLALYTPGSAALLVGHDFVTGLEGDAMLRSCMSFWLPGPCLPFADLEH